VKLIVVGGCDIQGAWKMDTPSCRATGDFLNVLEMGKTRFVCVFIASQK